MISICLRKCIIRSQGWTIYVHFINHITSYLKIAVLIVVILN